jgi:hypothetical protein
VRKEAGTFEFRIGIAIFCLTKVEGEKCSHNEPLWNLRITIDSDTTGEGTECYNLGVGCLEALAHSAKSVLAGIEWRCPSVWVMDLKDRFNSEAITATLQGLV